MNMWEEWVNGWVFGKYGEWGEYKFEKLFGNPITDKNRKRLEYVMHPSRIKNYYSGIVAGSCEIPSITTNLIMKKSDYNRYVDNQIIDEY